MAVLDYLRGHGLRAATLPDGRLHISPAANITDDIRDWIRGHKGGLLAELTRTDAERQASERVFEYRLSEWPEDQWGVLLMEPGDGIDVARQWCSERFGERVIDIRPYRPGDAA